MSDKPRLARHVTVGTTTYGPGDDVPDDVLEQITNPLAFVPLDEQPEAPRPRKRAGTADGHLLASTVAVGADMYGPDDFVPDDVARAITNPRAWKDGKVPDFGDRTVQEQPSPPPAGPSGAAGTGDDKTRKAPAAKRA